MMNQEQKQLRAARSSSRGGTRVYTYIYVYKMGLHANLTNYIYLTPGACMPKDKPTTKQPLQVKTAHDFSVGEPALPFRA